MEQTSLVAVQTCHCSSAVGVNPGQVDFHISLKTPGSGRRDGVVAAAFALNAP
jgi:hypothetical protein